MRTREIVVNGVIYSTAPEAVAITGGKAWELKYYLSKGATTYNGFNVQYLRQPCAPDPSSHEALDRFLREHKPVKTIKPIRIPERWPILSRRHITSHLGIYR